MLHFVARCSVLETSVNIFSFFFFATRSQSESMSQQGRQTCLRTERQAENCWCRLQIVPFWKMIRNRHHVVFQTYIDALITFKQGKEESSWNCSFEGHWNAQVVFDREKKKKEGYLSIWTMKKVISSLNLNSWTLFLEEPSSNTQHPPTLPAVSNALRAYDPRDTARVRQTEAT